MDESDKLQTINPIFPFILFFFRPHSVVAITAGLDCLAFSGTVIWSLHFC